MNIFLSVGHSILKNGSITSADGRNMGGCNEYLYNRNLVEKVEYWLEKAGHKVTVCIVPERKYTKSNDEISYKIPLENSGDYDLSVELHLNAFDGTAHGCEVYYYSNDGKEFAVNVVNELGKMFHNRGAMERKGLYWLNKTKATAILIESFFCDSKKDMDIADRYGLDAVGKAIAEGINGGKIQSGNGGNDKKLYRVQLGAFKDKGNAENLRSELKKKGYDCFVTRY